MMNSVRRFVREEEGATALEYGLLAALIAAAIVAAVTSLGNSVNNTFELISGKMDTAVTENQ